MSGQGSPSSENPNTKHRRQENKEQNLNRFQMELEFVSCLANPWYLNNLAQNGYFEDPAFMNYIKYLNYWQRPEYAKFIIYPHALYFLDLLQNPSFRENLKSLENTKHISHKQYYHWYNWRNVIGTTGVENIEDAIQIKPEDGYQDVENGLQSSGPAASGLNGRDASELENIFDKKFYVD